MTMTKTLNIVEIPYDDGTLRFRYSRYMSDDGTRWIRDGLFQSFYETGQISSEGKYEDGLENGLWTTYHRNGQKASTGYYEKGVEVGIWKFWNPDGSIAKE